MSFNENTRVKIPAILHLCKLGYHYLSLNNARRDENTNIFTDYFTESILRINPDLDNRDIKKIFDNITLALDNDDLGEAFFKMLTTTSGIKLIDFNDLNNNSYHVVTELTYKNGDDEFRPDITLLVNGMPLAFIEVKKPNNHKGILEERDRINARFKNKKFKKFINIFRFWFSPIIWTMTKNLLNLYKVRFMRQLLTIRQTSIVFVKKNHLI